MTPIVLLHGLMGRGRTWRRHVPWLGELGEVHTFDAAGHGRSVSSVDTEAFVADLALFVGALGPSIVIGHSMGALHAWCLAAAHPELVQALVIEDMAPDFRGRTADDWAAMMHAWPQPFATAQDVLDFFGDVAGQYFLDSFDHSSDGYRLHGDVDTFVAISAEWGTRDFWSEWDAVRAPTLLIEAEHGITPPGQMAEMHARGPDSEYVLVPGVGHLLHDEMPQRYRELVEAFLRNR
ncbi:hydrolase [Rhodococcoides trifolii]|uniref:Hydrolase n=1 Tax=Rhodococcoides trifolii TaxID=908250 RepID=A0A917LGH9_9NOCA|nr:alpha/beta hydrolase [Rhodococcus trifolii]GGG20800.1 hydrolase [Rhodococcus trifolii]